jgi:hypothetical protein
MISGEVRREVRVDSVGRQEVIVSDGCGRIWLKERR